MPRILHQLQHQLPPLITIVCRRERTTNEYREHSAPHNRRLDIHVLIRRLEDGFERLVHALLDIWAQREIPVLHGLQEQLRRRPEHLAREEAGPFGGTLLWLVWSRQGQQVLLDILHHPNQLAYRQVPALLVPLFPIRDVCRLREGPHYCVRAPHWFEHAVARYRADRASVRAE